ncbi:MAG TPA: hypothetical protein VJ692_11715 [Nitrospiraceae bacterium]|nr:hypothetical protein [Nitrospiraceae bacterium]
MTIEEAFCFMSSLYFRGKLTYAKQFIAGPGASQNSRIFIIAPGFGLVSPDWRLTLDRTRIMQDVGVDLKNARFRTPLEAHAAQLKATLDERWQVILLGSIASDKYVNALSPIFGDRLVAPRLFIGIGDMSRGALLLRCARSRRELEYMPLNPTCRRTRRRTFPPGLFPFSTDL